VKTGKPCSKPTVTPSYMVRPSTPLDNLTVSTRSGRVRVLRMCSQIAEFPPAYSNGPDTNARKYAALFASIPHLLDALETLAHGMNHDESSNDYQIVKQALMKAGYNFNQTRTP